MVGAEGVILVPDHSSYASSRPIQEGIELVMQLREFPTSLTSVIVGDPDPTPVDHFCKVHGLSKAACVGIAAEDAEEDCALAQWNALVRLRASGPINMVLTAYPLVYERCQSTHQPVLLFARRGALGQFDPKASWEDLHNRVIRHRDAEVERSLRDEPS